MTFHTFTKRDIMGARMSEFLEVPNFMLQKGGVLPLARLGYRTLGTLNAARDNAILVPS
jgi:homoserine O-acetyltransferase